MNSEYLKRKFSRNKTLKYIINDKGCYEIISHHKSRREGYNQITRFGKTWLASRLIFYVYHGYLPILVMHTCDNPMCINPEHLVAGTPKDNSQDMVNKNRQAKGEDNGGGVKLNSDKVIEIKQKLVEGKSLNCLAKEYDVSKKTILNIKQGKKWKHIKIPFV